MRLWLWKGLGAGCHCATETNWRPATVFYKTTEVNFCAVAFSLATSGHGAVPAFCESSRPGRSRIPLRAIGWMTVFSPLIFRLYAFYLCCSTRFFYSACGRNDWLCGHFVALYGGDFFGGGAGHFVSAFKSPFAPSLAKALEFNQHGHLADLPGDCRFSAGAHQHFRGARDHRNLRADGQRA